MKLQYSKVIRSLRQGAVQEPPPPWLVSEHRSMIQMQTMAPSRRSFLKSLATGASVFAAPYQRAAAALRNKVKITDVKCMIVRGTWDWNLIKIETDSGLYGIGEAYWGWGVKDLVVNKMKPIIVGEDPLNVEKLYTKMLMQSAGAGAIG